MNTNYKKQMKTAKEIHKRKMIQFDECDEEVYELWKKESDFAYKATMEAMEEYASEVTKEKDEIIQANVSYIEAANELCEEKEAEIKRLREALGNTLSLVKQYKFVRHSERLNLVTLLIKALNPTNTQG